MDNGRVAFDAHNVFEDGSDAVQTTALYFRTAEELRANLKSAGFGEIEVYAGWDQQPVTEDSRLLVFRAAKADEPQPAVPAEQWSPPTSDVENGYLDPTYPLKRQMEVGACATWW